MNIDFKVLQLCSGHILGDEYPDNWDNLTTDEQNRFIADNITEFYEGAYEPWVIEQIENLAWTTQRFINKHYTKNGELK